MLQAEYLKRGWLGYCAVPASLEQNIAKFI